LYILVEEVVCMLKLPDSKIIYARIMSLGKADGDMLCRPFFISLLLFE
jgi:hypothetical protein